MAVIGQQLYAPESGWQRYDDSHQAIGRSGAWDIVTGGSSTYWPNGNGTFTSTASSDAKIILKFYGTKLRLIGATSSDRSTNATISFDNGTSETFSMHSTSITASVLFYEKKGLHLGEHKVVISAGTTNFYKFVIDAIDIDNDGYFIIGVGSPLTAPESGWKRYDNFDSEFKIEGEWTTYSNANLWRGRSVYFNSTLTDGKISFKFYGSKLRFIGYGDPTYNKSIKITLDGQSETFSSASDSVLPQMICYEKTNLQQGLHYVVMDCNGSSAYWHFDAIDIDFDGRIIHPDEVTKIAELDIGKRIRCHYQTTASNTVGLCSGLGQQTSDFIPASSSAVPNGDFYFIMVEDWNGKNILIADRNIQSSLSWDTLNTNGIVSGSGIPVNQLSNKEFFISIRLLTGGINASDKDNEWDKYIVSSNLNGKISAGDNNVWNWNGVNSWTSTSNPSASSNRIRRGGTSVTAWATSDVTITTNGFRPVLQIDTLPLEKNFIYHDGSYKKWDAGWNTISATLPLEDTFINDGMDDLSVLDRKNAEFVQSMSVNDSLGSGKVFKASIDLKKYFEITKMNVK
ncbi:hypothetical protein BK129_03100 [Paenibacillus amylolyticus]|uniref:hypothetical protein n=1 Tax=Paenibacillus amylolyticus TaxID=1451 RepID=UPI00096F9ACA|nr:hypothetical protein [Paenibacillus amylolyticus]OMF09839.1 hypothetical protein BK129_03100 [Paenibacillus amylolyticus]